MTVLAPPTPPAFLQPRPGETRYCDILIIGGSAAAYAAALTALAAGHAQVCLVQPHAYLGGQYHPRSWQHGQLLRQSGHRRLAGEDFAISQRQRQLRQLYRQLATDNQPLFDQPAVQAAAISASVRQLLTPYLDQRRCKIIVGAVPQQVLYSDRRGHLRQVKRVIFSAAKAPFAVQSKVVVDAGVGLGPTVRSLLPAAALHTLTPWAFLPTGNTARGEQAHSVGIFEPGLWRQPPSPPVRALPTALPLGCLIPAELEGLVLSGDQIGLSAQVRSLSQFFPVAWAIGEASGALAASAIATGSVPAVNIAVLQRGLLHQGVPLVWFDDVATSDPDFAAFQTCALTCAPGKSWLQNRRNLHAAPEKRVNRSELAAALVQWQQPRLVRPAQPTFADVRPDHWAYAAIETAYTQGWLREIAPARFAPAREAIARPLLRAIGKPTSQAASLDPAAPLTRRQLVRLLFTPS